MTKNGCNGEQYLEAGKGGFGLLGTGEGTECGGQPSQRCRYLTVSYKAQIEVGETQELLELSSGGWDRPLGHCLDLGRVR